MITEAKSAAITGRIARLKEKVISVKSTICTERARIYTKVYQEHEETPVILKRAYALERTLKEMSVFIDEGELIVGNQSSALRAAPIFPEYVTSWIINELDEFDKRPGDAFFVTEEQKRGTEGNLQMVGRKDTYRKRLLNNVSPEQGDPRFRNYKG